MIDKEKQRKLYDNSPSEDSSGEAAKDADAATPASSKEVAEAAPKDDEMTFARWMQATDSVRKASGLPLKSKKDQYEQWLKLQGSKS